MRKKRKYAKTHNPDIKYDSVAIGRFVNYLMERGKKSTAEKIIYQSLDKIQSVSQSDAVEIFNKAIENASPLLEVVSKRVGGANYQVPREVRPERKFFLACKWIIEGAQARKGKAMAEKLAEEILGTAKGEGAAIKKKQNMHRMAEANRAFAHFAR